MTTKEVHIGGFKGYGKVGVPLRTVNLLYLTNRLLIEAQIKDNKDQFGCSIDDFNKIVSYSRILDFRVCVLYFHHTFR